MKIRITAVVLCLLAAILAAILSCLVPTITWAIGLLWALNGVMVATEPAMSRAINGSDAPPYLAYFLSLMASLSCIASILAILGI